MPKSTDNKGKVRPVWTDTLAGVEVSVYRNVIKGQSLPMYKVTRKKWYEKGGELQSNYTLSRADWAIARSLENDAWRDIGNMARAERAQLTSASKQDVEEELQDAVDDPADQ